MRIYSIIFDPKALEDIKKIKNLTKLHLRSLRIFWKSYNCIRILAQGNLNNLNTRTEANGLAGSAKNTGLFIL